MSLLSSSRSTKMLKHLKSILEDLGWDTMTRESIRKRAANLLRVILTIAVMLFLGSRFFSTSLYEGEEGNSVHYLRFKVAHARNYDFVFRITENGKRIVSSSPHANLHINLALDFYEDIVLVHSEEDSFGFPDNIAVAWPRLDSPFLHSELEWLNASIRGASERWTRRRGGLFDIGRVESEFGLTLPITVEDLVDNWESVWNLRVEVEP